MAIKKSKEELELMSNKDVAELIIEDSKKQFKTLDLFTKIVKLKELPESTIDKKIADFYMQLSTDKRFILLENGKWDLKHNHTSDKIIKVDEYDEELDDESELDEEEDDDDLTESQEDSYSDDDVDDYDDDDDYKDLVVVDEDEMEQDIL